MPNYSVGILLYLVLCTFYTVTICYNHAENLDGLQYAFAAEKASLTYIWDVRAFLFQLTNKLIFLAAEGLGLTTRSFLPIAAFTILISSASVLLMARLLIAGFGLSPVAGWAGAGMLALSYGFWRYASAVEVYNGSVFLILIVANLLLSAGRREQSRWFYLSAASVVSAIATLYYQPNAVILFIAASAFILRTTGIKGLFLHGTVGGLLVVSGYLSAYIISENEFPSIQTLVSFITGRNEELSSSGFHAGLIFKSFYYAVKSFCSVNWIFSVELLDRIMTELSPRRDHATLKFPILAFKPLVYVSFITVTGLAISLVSMLRTSLKTIRVAKLDPKFLFVGGALVCYVPILLLHGRHFEVWIPVLPFFIILISLFLFENTVRSGRVFLPVLFVGIFGLHNYVGGIGPLQSAQNDYMRKAISGVESAATGDDTVIIFRNRINHIETRNYLLYYGGVNVLTVQPGATLLVPSTSYQLRWQSFDQHLRDIGASNGRALVLQDFFEPDERIRNFPEGPAVYRYYRSLGDVFRDGARLVHEGDAGKIYAVQSDGEMASRVAEIPGTH